MAGGVGGRADVIMTFAAGIGNGRAGLYWGDTFCEPTFVPVAAGYYSLLEMERTNAPRDRGTCR